MDLLVFLGRVIGNVVKFLRATLPELWKVVAFVAKAMAETLAATFRGWGPTAREIADDLTNIVLSKFIVAISMERVVYHFFLTFAYITIVAGWISLSYLTVFLVQWFFR